MHAYSYKTRLNCIQHKQQAINSYMPRAETETSWWKCPGPLSYQGRP